MKAFSAILFSVFFLLTSMQQTTFLVLYKLNEKTITEKYCVNKNVPGSCCHGKCHLNKTIATSENENKKNPFSTSNSKGKEVEVFCMQLQSLLSFFPHEVAKPTNNYSCTLSEGISFSLIKPPTYLG